MSQVFLLFRAHWDLAAPIAFFPKKIRCVAKISMEADVSVWT